MELTKGKLNSFLMWIGGLDAYADEVDAFLEHESKVENLPISDVSGVSDSLINRKDELITLLDERVKFHKIEDSEFQKGYRFGFIDGANAMIRNVKRLLVRFTSLAANVEYKNSSVQVR